MTCFRLATCSVLGDQEIIYVLSSTTKALEENEKNNSIGKDNKFSRTILHTRTKKMKVARRHFQERHCLGSQLYCEHVACTEYACICMYVYIYINVSIYLYIYMLTPPETYRFRFLLCFTVIFVGCCLQKLPAFFHSFEDFGCLNMMSHDASCVDTMTYFDGICSVSDYPIAFPTKGFNSNIDRMRTALWPNAKFKLYIGFYNVFVPFCDT